MYVKILMNMYVYQHFLMQDVEGVEDIINKIDVEDKTSDKHIKTRYIYMYTHIPIFVYSSIYKQICIIIYAGCRRGGRGS
jgi:hypothetical protein